MQRVLSDRAIWRNMHVARAARNSQRVASQQIRALRRATKSIALSNSRRAKSQSGHSSRVFPSRRRQIADTRSLIRIGGGARGTNKQLITD